jgi:hypothetical protein
MSCLQYMCVDVCDDKVVERQGSLAALVNQVVLRRLQNIEGQQLNKPDATHSGKGILSERP